MNSGAWVAAALAAALRPSGSPPEREVGGGEHEPLVGFLPLVVLPRGPLARGASAQGELGPELRGLIGRYLSRRGAILFRGFLLPEDADFERFMAAANEPEAASRERVWIWCAGAGPRPSIALADRRELYHGIPARVRRRWAERGLRYVSRRNGSECVTCIQSPIAWHAPTAEPRWACPLLLLRSPIGAPCRPSLQVTHADGSPLDALEVLEVNAALTACTTRLPWQAEDALLLDASLVAYALEPSDRADTLRVVEPAD